MTATAHAIEPDPLVGTDDPLLDTETAAEMLGQQPQTLVNWRCRRVGPDYLKIGRTVRYEQSALERYRQASIVRCFRD